MSVITSYVSNMLKEDCDTSNRASKLITYKEKSKRRLFMWPSNSVAELRCTALPVPFLLYSPCQSLIMRVSRLGRGLVFFYANENFHQMHYAIAGEAHPTPNNQVYFTPMI